MSKAGLSRLRPGGVALVDGSYILHRSMHLPGAESGPHGAPIGAAMKSLQSLTTIVRTLRPCRVFWVHDFDKHPNRVALYPEYKKKTYKDEQERQEAENYRNMYIYQRDILLQALPLFGINVIYGPHESDDSIWYLSNTLDQYSVDSYVVTGDKDFMQLLTEHSMIYVTHKELIVTPENYQDWSTWSPWEVILAKGILGDSSDNIPSPCKGLGPTGVRKLIDAAEGPSLAQVVEAVKTHFPKAKKYQSLLEPEVQAQIERNIQLVWFWSGLAMSEEERQWVWMHWHQRAVFNWQGVMQFMTTYEMNPLIRTYGNWAQAFEVLS